MNKNTLNAQRLLQYFRKDWSENAAQLYYYFIIPYGIMTLLFIWMDFTKTHSVVVALEQVRQGMETDNNSYQLIMENALSGKDDCWFSIVFTAVLCFDFFMAFAGSTFFKTSKYRKDYITDLTFPVSNAEKFIVRWFRISIISFPIFCLATVLADFTRIGFIHFLYPEVSLSFPVPWLSSECDVYLPLAILQAYCLQALFILGGTYWQKKPFQKTLSLVLLTSLIYYSTYLFHRTKLCLPRCPNAMGYRLGIRYSHLPHLVWLPTDLPPHAPCHTPPVMERQDHVSGLCSLAHRTGTLRLDAELHRGPFRLRIKPESPHKDIVLPNDV